MHWDVLICASSVGLEGNRASSVGLEGDRASSVGLERDGASSVGLKGDGSDERAAKEQGSLAEMVEGTYALHARAPPYKIKPTESNT